MKKSVIIIIVLAALVLGYFLINQLVINSYDGATYSRNIDQSKNNGMFLGEFCPNQDSIHLLDKKVIALKSWVEISWESDHNFVFIPSKKEETAFINLIIPDTLSLKGNSYMYTTLGNGNIITNGIHIGYVFQFPRYLDKFTVYIVQPSKDKGWEKEIIVDSLTYSKCK